MANFTDANRVVMEYKEFLVSRETGFTQGSLDWVNAHLSTVGASEISALTGSSPFETPSSLLLRKLQPRDTFTKNVACTWGSLFQKKALWFCFWV